METLLTTKDIAKLAGCRPVTVRSWRAKHGDFPRPAAVYGDTPIRTAQREYAPLKNQDLQDWLMIPR